MFENKLAVQAFSKLDLFLEGALDKELTSAIRGRAIIGGLCMAIPLWGIETIVYIIALWGMYGKVAQISTVPFKDHLLRNVGGAVVINVIIGVVAGFVFDLIPGLGWALSFVVGYASITISGMAYVKALKSLHGNKAKANINIQRGLASMNNNTGVSKQTSSYIKKINEYVDVPAEFNTVDQPQQGNS